MSGTSLALAQNTQSQKPSNSEPINFFNMLPPELVLSILRFLTPAELFRIRLVCQNAYSVSTDASLWEKQPTRLQHIARALPCDLNQHRRVLIPLVKNVPAEVNYYYDRTVESLIVIRKAEPTQVEMLGFLLQEIRRQAITSFESNFEILLSLLELIKQINTVLGEVQLKNSLVTDIQYLTRLTPQFVRSAVTLLGERTKTLTFSGSPDNVRLLRDAWPVGLNSSVFTRPPLDVTNISYNLQKALARRQHLSPVDAIEAKRVAGAERQAGIRVLYETSRNRGATTNGALACFLRQDAASVPQPPAETVYVPSGSRCISVRARK